MKVKASIFDGDDILRIKEDIETKINSDSYSWESFYDYLKDLNQISGITQFQDILASNPILGDDILSEKVREVIFTDSTGEDLKEYIKKSVNFSLVNFEDNPLTAVDEGDLSVPEVPEVSDEPDLSGSRDDDMSPDFDEPDSSGSEGLPEGAKVESPLDIKEEEEPKIEHTLNRIVWKDKEGKEHTFVSDCISDMSGVKAIFKEEVDSLISVNQVNFSNKEDTEEAFKIANRIQYLEARKSFETGTDLRETEEEIEELRQEFDKLTKKSEKPEHFSIDETKVPSIELEFKLDIDKGNVVLKKIFVKDITSTKDKNKTMSIFVDGEEFKSFYELMKTKGSSEKISNVKVSYIINFDSKEQRDELTRDQLLSLIPTIPTVSRSEYKDALINFAAAKKRLWVTCSDDGCIVHCSETDIQVNGWAEAGKAPEKGSTGNYYFNVPESLIKTTLEKWVKNPPSEVSKWIKDKNAFKSSVETILGSL